MKHILISIFTLFFLTHVSALADELIDSEEVVQEEIVADQDTEVASEATQESEPATTEDTPSEEEIAAAHEAEEAAHAEEEELREVGAGEEPVIEE